MKLKNITKLLIMLPVILAVSSAHAVTYKWNPSIREYGFKVGNMATNSLVQTTFDKGGNDKHVQHPYAYNGSELTKKYYTDGMVNFLIESNNENPKVFPDLLRADNVELMSVKNLNTEETYPIFFSFNQDAVSHSLRVKFGTENFKSSNWKQGDDNDDICVLLGQGENPFMIKIFRDEHQQNIGLIWIIVDNRPIHSVK